jgi:DNA polymerase (family X)
MSVNQALAARFETIGKLIELLGEDSFRAAAHAKAARILGDLAIDVEPLARGPDAKKQLTAIDGVGAKIAEKIIEFVATGRMKELDELEARVPGGLLPLLAVQGLGPKTVGMLWREGGVTSASDLKRIIADGSILKLPRMGAKTVENVSANLAFLEQNAGSQRRLHLGLALPIAERITQFMLGVPGVSRAAYAGSLRRMRETVGDLDVLVSTTDPAAAAKAFCAMDGVHSVLAAGDRKSSIRLSIRPDSGRWDADKLELSSTVQVDLRVIDEASWGAALMYFTGSKEHNVKLRERALSMGMTLNEYGLFPEDEEKTPPQARGVKPVASATEHEVYAKLGMEWVPPELREDRGEMQAFESSDEGSGDGSWRLIEVTDIKAELHAHTTASDGVMSIVELATLARSRGFHTVAVTDHSRSSAIAGGLSEERLREHIKAVHAARALVPGIALLAGSEVDILADGSLDYSDELLAELDTVVASPHAALSQEPAVATRRLVRAIEHPMTRVLGHPTGRIIGKRPGLSPDMSAIIQAAKRCNVALEINAHWLRLDLRDTHVQAAVEAGCLIAINCDIHEPSDADGLRFGVATARRGWLTQEQCVNTWSADRLHRWLRTRER